MMERKLQDLCLKLEKSLSGSHSRKRNWLAFSRLLSVTDISRISVIQESHVNEFWRGVCWTLGVEVGLGIAAWCVGWFLLLTGKLIRLP